ncbi:MAG TPA: hypothetical protein VF771_01235, partial [Longimicrobiaceae bacterium]
MLFALACRDISLETVRTPTPRLAFAQSSFDLTAIGPGWRTDPAEPYACLATHATQSGPIPYLYRRVPLHLSPELESPDGTVAALRYQAVRSDGSVVAVLNCVIPANDRAREAVARRFGIPLAPEIGGVILEEEPGCATDQVNGLTNDCEISGVTGTAKPQDSPVFCNGNDYCVPGYDPYGGGGAGGGDG